MEIKDSYCLDTFANLFFISIKIITICLKRKYLNLSEFYNIKSLYLFLYIKNNNFNKKIFRIFIKNIKQYTFKVV